MEEFNEAHALTEEKALPNRVPSLWPVTFGMVGIFVLPSLAALVITVLVAKFDHNLLAGTGKIRSQEISGIIATNIVSQVVEYIFMWAGLLLCALFFANNYSRDWRSDLGWKMEWRKDLPLAIAVVLITWFAVGIYAIGFQKLTHTSVQNLGNSSAVLHPHSHWRWVFAIIAICCAPVVEEIFFRGLTLYTLAARYGSVVGVIVSAILFAVVHVQTTLKSSEVTCGLILIVGLIFGFVKVKTGRLGVTILAHMLFNGAATLVALRS